MPKLKQLSKLGSEVLKSSKQGINWHPGHMFGGMQAMIGKLNTVDCVIEVHDARIPFTGRNREFREHLGRIKPHVLVLNKKDLADLSRWDKIKQRLYDEGDENVLLTDLTGSDFSFADRGFNQLLDKVIKLINERGRFNREALSHYKVMFVGIPNVGKSTLINRLRQHHLGFKGEPAKAGAEAGVTRKVQNMIRICSRPPIYSLDTPGVLKPGSTKSHKQAMRLALCSSINDARFNPEEVAEFLLEYLHSKNNYSYQYQFQLDSPVKCLNELIARGGSKLDLTYDIKSIESGQITSNPDAARISRKLIKDFRRGLYGKVMFD